MKPKVFRDALWPIGLGAVLVLMGLSLLPIWGSVVLIEGAIEATSSQIALQYILGALMSVAVAIGGIACANYHLIYDIGFRRLYVYEKKVVLRCFLRKTITLTIENCKYVGVDDYSLLNRVLPVSRGDEVSYIYLSEKPYPQKYRGKITALKSKKGFIKFRYSDTLAEALLEILPDNKDYMLKSFYGRMKANDSFAKAKNKKKKKK